MNLPTALCRAQEILHLRRAAETSLANVRRVATEAAAAWAKEALVAERREERQASLGARADASRAGERRGDVLPDENPDRGLASIAS